MQTFSAQYDIENITPFNPQMGQYTWNALTTVSLAQPGRGAILFTAEAPGDVFVAISPQYATVDPMYEIVFGATNKTTTVIRRSAMGPILASAPGGVDYNIPTQAWFSIDRTTSTLQIGRGDIVGQGVLLSWHDPSFLQAAQYASFTNWGAMSQYTNIRSVSLPVALPARNGQYTWAAPFVLPEAGRGTIAFNVQGSNDIHIAISPQAATVDPMYEIVIGGWGNAMTALRRSSQGEVLATAPVGLANPGGDNPMWVSLDYTTGMIQVGRGAVGNDVILSWQDPSFLQAARYVDFSTWDSPATFTEVRRGLPDWTVSQLFSQAAFVIPPGSGQVCPTAVYTVPPNANGVLITAIGGKGNSAPNLGLAEGGNGGRPARITGIFPISAGKQIYVVTAQNGSEGGFPGAGHGAYSGGGVSLVATTQPTQNGRNCTVPKQSLLLAAGGGGGGGTANSVGGSGGNGGDAGRLGGLGANAGAGSGSQAGGSGWGASLHGGGARAGAATGWHGDITWTDGGAFQGGQARTDDENNPDAGGCGGAGYYGGGAGSSAAALAGAGGGGGGSSFITNALSYASSIDTSGAPSVTITPLTLRAQPLSPSVDNGPWAASLPLAGSASWVPGCKVRYHVAYEYSDGSELHGPWWNVPGGAVDVSGYFQPAYASPTLVNISADPTNQAVARRIYRQFLGQAATRVGRIANNTDSTFVDTDPGQLTAPPRWGLVSIGDNSVTGVKRASISLPGGFDHAPAVVLATAAGADYTDTFGLSTSVVAVPASTLNAFRVDAASSWGQIVGAGVIVCDALALQNLQAGSTSVGASTSSNLTLKTIPFRLPFAQPPRVMVTARGQDYIDSFSVTVTGVSTTSFTCNIQRLESGVGWGQSLSIDWIAFTPEGLADFHATKADSGIATIGEGPPGVKRVPVTFNQPFSTVPTVHLTSHGEGYNDVFAVTATNVSPSGFTANVKRADVPANGWGQNLGLDWLALV